MKRNLIILGGNSSNNIYWINKMKHYYEKDYNVYTFYYDNWFNENDFNYEKEIVKLKDIIEKIDNYIIIAKSIGIIFTIKAMQDKIVKPDKLICLGVPIYVTEKNGINMKTDFDQISNIANILVIQQKFDPTGKSIDVKNILNNKIEFQEINGKSHVYGAIDNIKKIVDQFINEVDSYDKI